VESVIPLQNLLKGEWLSWNNTCGSTNFLRDG